MKTNGSLFIVCCFLMIIPSCTTYLSVQKELPPEIALHEQSNSIVFINYFNYISPINIAEKHRNDYHAGLKGLVKGISASFAGDSTIDFFIGDTLRKSIEKGHQTILLSKDSVQRMCSLYNADMLLAMDSLKVFFDWETLVDEHEDGSKSRTKKIYLFFRAFCSLYAANGDLINRNELERSSLYTSRPAERLCHL